MRYYNFEGYRLSLRATNRRDSYGHIMVSYKFTSPQKETIFEGEDFGASPLYQPESKANAIALLSFLTLKPGDTDAEYFEKYTPRQMEFAQSIEAESLRFVVYEWEEKQSRRKAK